MSTVTCHVTQKEVPEEEAQLGRDLRPQLFRNIRKEHPGFTKESYISPEALNEYRKKHLASLIRQENRDLNRLEKEVVEAITHNKILSENIEPAIEDRLTVGQRLADHIASFGGSWTFIIIFFSFLLVWMAINVIFLLSHAFDPYPFILLNLILSCLAAIQAPIIMMSQNRKDAKDRQRSEYDYKINLKAELEIKLLHEKVDHLMIHQNRRLLEIQEIQAEYLQDILDAVKPKNPGSTSGG
jgi:uncharacterized membrane protein